MAIKVPYHKIKPIVKQLREAIANGDQIFHGCIHIVREQVPIADEKGTAIEEIVRLYHDTEQLDIVAAARLVYEIEHELHF